MTQKTIIITGTSRGIGLELVQKFAKNNYQVIAISRNPKPTIALNNSNIISLGIDLCNPTDLNQLTNLINQKNIQITGLIHNAGKLINKPFEALTLENFKEVYAVNVFGVAMLTQVCLPYFKKNSHIVTISSMGGIQGSIKFPGLAAYSSSKGAVITLMELLAEEFKTKKIACNTLALGAVQTEMLEEAFPGYIAPTTPIEMAAYIYNFTLTGHKYYNGKVLQVSNTTP